MSNEEKTVIHTHEFRGGKFTIPYVRISETPLDSQEDLREFMYGQTVPIIPGIDPQDAIYPWDYENFLSGGRLFWD